MAFVDHAPFSEAEIPVPFTTQPFGDGFPVSFVGLQAYNEAQEGVGIAFGAATGFGRHVVCVEDQFAGTNQGRRMELYTLGDSVLTANTFDPSGRLLTGVENTDPPDFAVYKGTVGMVDGVGRAAPSGDGAVLTQFAQVRDGVKALERFNISDDGGVFTVNRFSAASGGVHTPFAAAPAVGDAELFGFKAPFGVQFINFIFGTNTFNGTITWEYFDGTSFVALSGVVDGTTNYSVSNTQAVVTFDIPTNWATTTISGEGPFFFVRARISAFVGGVSIATTNNHQVDKVLESQPAPVPNVLAPPLNIFDSGTDLNVGDVVYWGAIQTFSKVRLAATSDGASNVTLVFEFFNGTAFVALAGVVDGTSAFTTAATPQDITFTVPGTWATTTISETSPTLFWIRARVTVITTAYSAVQSTTFAIATLAAAATTAILGQAPVAYDIGTAPGSGENRAPEVIGWGIPLPAGIVASGSGLFTYWDPVRKIHSRRFALPGGNYVPLHGEPAVTDVAQWSGTDVGASIVGTSATGITFSLDTTKADTSITIGADAGPPVFYDETKLDRDFTKQGYTTAVLRNRTYVARNNELIWSESGEFHQFPPANQLEVAPNDGDEIVAIRPYADKILIFKRKRIYAFVGEPSIGVAGLAIVEISATVGCLAKRTIAIVGDRIYFLSEQGVMLMTAAGAVEVLPVSLPVRRTIQNSIDQFGANMHAAAGAFDPRRKLYLISFPGIQASTSGGEGPGQTLNDGVLAFCERNGQWATWLDAGNRSAAMATVFVTSNTQSVLSGDYWGMLWLLKQQQAFVGLPHRFWGDGHGTTGGQRAQGSFPVTGIVTGGGVSTISISSGTLPVADTGSVVDTTFIGHTAWVIDEQGDGQMRWIIRTRTGPNEIDVVPALTGPANTATILRVGALYWHADTGDLVFGDLTDEQELRAVRVRLAGTTLPDSNLTGTATVVEPLDVAVAVLDEGRPDASGVNSANFVWPAGTVRFGVNPKAVFMPVRRGLLTRIRFTGFVGATGVTPGLNVTPLRIIGARFNMHLMATTGIL